MPDSSKEQLCDLHTDQGAELAWPSKLLKQTAAEVIII